MKKSFSVVAAIFAMTPVLLACNKTLDCIKDVVPMRDHLTSIQNALETADRATRLSAEGIASYERREARATAWLDMCRAMEANIAALPDDKKKVDEVLADNRDEKDFQGVKPLVQSLSNNLKKLRDDGKFLCEYVYDTNPDPNDLSSGSASNVRKQVAELLKQMRQHIRPHAVPLATQVCKKYPYITFDLAPAVMPVPAADPRATSAAAKPVLPAPAAPAASTSTSGSLQGVPVTAGSAGASVSTGGSIGSGSGR
jgi:hypothetical protein